MSAQRAAQLVEAGLWLQMSGDVDGARRLFEQALKLDPSNARAKQLLATANAAATEDSGGFTPLATAASATPPDSAPVEPGPSEGELDWSSATGLDRAPTPPGLSPRGQARPPAVAPVAPPSGAALGAADELGFAPLAEPMPPAGGFTGSYPDPDPDPDLDIPVQLPAPEPTPTAGTAAVIRPINFAPNATSAWDSQSNPGVHLQDVEQGMGDAMDLVAEPRASGGAAPGPGSPAPSAVSATPSREQVQAEQLREEVETLLNGARDLLDLDDHTGAIELILKAQQLSPNDPHVQAMRERSEKTLQAMFESKLGDMTQRPRVALKEDEIIWLNLDHRAGFVLAQIDGSVSFEDLFEVCGMSRLDTARILAQLVEEGVITTS